MSEMPKILLVEDAKDCQILVKEALSNVSAVQVAETLQEAKQALKNESFDLILLDLSLPDGSGMEFFSRLREQDYAEIPVVFLTAQGESSVQVAAFSLGADDFIVKPLRPVEFRARVEAKLKKLAREKSSEAVLVKGALRIELGLQRAFIVAKDSKKELDLTGREFKLLYHMAKNEGKAFSRDQLIAAVWGTGVHILDRTVDTHVYTLRKKLGAYSGYIESQVGLGYRLNTARPKKEVSAA